MRLLWRISFTVSPHQAQGDFLIRKAKDRSTFTSVSSASLRRLRGSLPLPYVNRVSNYTTSVRTDALPQNTKWLISCRCRYRPMICCHVSRFTIGFFWNLKPRSARRETNDLHTYSSQQKRAPGSTRSPSRSQHSLAPCQRPPYSDNSLRVHSRNALPHTRHYHSFSRGLPRKEKLCSNASFPFCCSHHSSYPLLLQRGTKVTTRRAGRRSVNGS
jgi:hypothetical protein